MGYEQRTATVRATVDRHGDDRQKRDDDLWDELLEELRKVVEQKKYEPIRASV